jgi:hypothetical protein
MFLKDYYKREILDGKEREVLGSRASSPPKEK